MVRGSRIILILLLFQACTVEKQPGNITFRETGQGVEALEDGRLVFFYQREPRSSHGKYTYNNYIHPLYSLSGDTLTEEFPEDHIYHRGVYWAWTQVYVAGESVGNGWTQEEIRQEVTGIDTGNSVMNVKTGRMVIQALWRSPHYGDGRAFLSEETEIILHASMDTYRAIDFRISLSALVPEVEIGGSDNAKGYGGLCVRIRNTDQLTFTSLEEEVTPQELQVIAGPWMDFSGPFGSGGRISGLAILCHPQTPNYPAPWILRSEASMQNVVYPGRERVRVPMDEALTLYYRLIIHDGDAKSLDLNKLQRMYERENFK